MEGLTTQKACDLTIAKCTALGEDTITRRLSEEHNHFEIPTVP